VAFDPARRRPDRVKATFLIPSLHHQAPFHILVFLKNKFPYILISGNISINCPLWGSVLGEILPKQGTKEPTLMHFSSIGQITDNQIKILESKNLPKVYKWAAPSSKKVQFTDLQPL
jgi:hypothetical protein